MELIESEFEPTRQQRMHFLNLSNGANDNEFDFSIDDDEIHSLIEEIKDGFQDDIDRKLAGAYAQTLALRGTDDDLSIAWEIEELLRQDSAENLTAQTTHGDSTSDANCCLQENNMSKLVGLLKLIYRKNSTVQYNNSFVKMDFLSAPC